MRHTSLVVQMAGVSRRRPPPPSLGTLVAACMVLSACLPGRTSPAAATPAGPIHATAIPAASPTALALDTPRPRPTTGPCTHDATFVADVTIPDGTRVEPGAPLDKSWRVRNSGTCNWGPGYALVLVEGPSMGADQVSGLFPARAGAEVEIQLSLTAPSEPGEHTTTWRLRDPEGQLFGDVLFITIVVAEAP